MKKFIAFLSYIFILMLSHDLVAQNTQVKDLVVDGFDTPIPFAAVTILNKNIGISTTEDGEFSLLVTSNELQDTLSISSLGFKTFTVKVSDYLAQKQQKITIEEDVFEMDEVVLLSPRLYVIEALKRLKENTLSTPHKLQLLYRRAATEEGRSKFFVENYIKLRDRGPAYPLGSVQVVQARKSADYRAWKRTQWRHSIVGMSEKNPLRPISSQHFRNIKKFIWNKIGESAYEGEDVLILEGKNPKEEWKKIILYVGVDSYKVYRIERGRALYIYKNHDSGKLVLNYFKDYWQFPRWAIPSELLGTVAETLLYKIEDFVYSVETDRKKIGVRSFGADKDMGSIKLSYNASFWSRLNLPPDTKFYKRIKKEQEQIFGVPSKYNIV